MRVAILPALIGKWKMYRSGTSRPLATFDDCTFAQALESYPRGYIDGEPTAERILETLERFEEDTTDTSRIHASR